MLHHPELNVFLLGQSKFFPPTFNLEIAEKLELKQKA